MMTEDRVEYKNPLGRQLFSLYMGGVYVTNADLVSIGRELGKSYPYKSREGLMEEIYKDLEKEGKLQPFLEKLAALFQKRVGEYAGLLAAYPAAGDVMEKWIANAQRTATRLETDARGEA